MQVPLVVHEPSLMSPLQRNERWREEHERRGGVKFRGLSDKKAIVYENFA